MAEKLYTSTLNAGMGMFQETQILLDLWQPGMDTAELQRLALASGQFPKMTARRLKNFVMEGFAAFYLRGTEPPALLLKRAVHTFTRQEIEQLLLIYISRVHVILADFIQAVYWTNYAAGRETISFEEARSFVLRAVQDGQTTTAWSESTIKRVGSYLTSYCADFGLLERAAKSTRRILAYRIEPRAAAILAYDLHFSGHGDNAVLSHPDWGLFGLERLDVLEELKRLALRNLMLVQAAGGVTKISWRYETMEELLDVLTRTELQ